MALQLIIYHNQKTISSSSHFLLLLLLLLWLTKTSAALSYARVGCQERCGNVTIPYPFGIGAGCYLDNFYSVDCRNSNTSHFGIAPFLTSNDLEVLEISLDSNYIRVNNPVIYSPNCSTTNHRNNSVDLRFTPFHFSEINNIFMVIGARCNGNDNNNKDAIIINLETNKNFTQCTTSCDRNNITSCATEISPYVKYLQGYAVNFASTASCTYGFLVDSETQALETGYQNVITGASAAVQIHVPAVLEWVVRYNTTQLGLVPDSKNSPCFPLSYAYSSSSPLDFGGCGVVQSIKCYCNFPFVGNPYLPNGCVDVCSTETPLFPLCNKSQKSKTAIIIAVCAGLAGGLFLLIAAWWFYKVIKKRNDKKRKEKFFKRNGGFLLRHKLSSSDSGVEKIKLFNSKELEKATDHYNEDRILGQGGQDGRIIAIKKSKVVNEGQVEQFINEVVILSQIIHRNVVKLLGCCLETDVPMLVYEFIPNGTLSQIIHDPNEEFQLSWEMRFRIAIEVAGALSYLHSAASIPIYHRDMKSTNILLDDKYRAKVSDFGISISIDVDRTHLTTQVQGTFGYLDPEYFQSGQFIDKSDVYSFGVVIIELLTGQKAISSARSQESRSLVTHFMQSMEENNLLEILDPRILKDGRREEMIVVAHLARRCLHLNGKKRPTMKDVAVELEGIRMSQGDSTTHQLYEEVEYNTTDIFEAWDVASTSTGTFFDSGTVTTSSFDVQPLLHSK